MLCCVSHTCSCAPFLSLLLRSIEMRPFFSSVTLRVIMPRTSMFCSPPSRPQVRDIFSSTLRCTLGNTVHKLPLTTDKSWKYIYIALFTILIVSKLLHSINQNNLTVFVCYWKKKTSKFGRADQ